MVILSDHEDSASTSSLKRKRSCNLHYHRYDIFLSFRGSDTRYGFTDHLYDHLKRAGISTFRDDDELERGESLKQQLEKAIKESSVLIIVFSENYASSSWCLDELVRILEQKIQGDHKVLPIFYRVDASDVRYQRGSYKEALNRHIEKGYVGLDKINMWKAALTEAAGLSGFTLDSDNDKCGPETEFIGRIVCEVENSLPNRRTLDVPERLVGMNYRAIGIDLWLKDRSSDNNVLIVCGIGGIGKTTIAKYFFNEYFRDFEGSCFLARITMRWNQIGVCRLQSQLLSIILNKREEVRIYNCDEGTEKIKRAICNRKVLLVLDDVSETEQLEALLGQPQRLCPGSKILVTTRNMSLRKDFTIPPKVHNVECLKDEDSLKLFSWHAFRQLLPLEEYIQITKETLLRCGRLPLALVILGSSLRKKLDIVFWKKQLQKWDEIGNPDVQKVMQISYDSLEDETVKNLFLHVACFFVGEEEDYVVKILDHCGLHATVGIQNLIDRCLITTTYDNKLMMHQVIQDMGREIVRQECPNEPGRRSRLWFHEDSFIVLKYDQGSEVVQGLILDGQKIIKAESDRPSFPAADANPHLITRLLDYVNKKKEEVLDRYLPSKKGEMRIDSFAKMVNLKLLRLNYVHLTGRCNKFPKELRWISWHGFPLEYVPMELPLKNLVAFDLQHSLLKQVWKGYMELKSLKFLNLSYSLELCQTPDFRGLLQLERLILRGCSNLVKVSETIGILKALLLLDFRDCKSLRDLPDLPESLLTLDLSGCSHLGEFPIEQRNVKPSDGYRVVKFASSNISTGPVKLLAYLPRLLVKLSLEGCNLSDECFPRYFSGLSSLETLDLSGNLITRLPNCVRNPSNSGLSKLNISNCPQLQSVIHPPSAVIDLYLENKKQLGKTRAGLKRKHFHLITDEMTKHIENEGCFKWVKAGIVERKVIKNLGLELVPIGCMGKVLYQFGIFSTYVKNTTRVPGCFKTYYTDGEDDSTGCIKVPFGETGRTKLQYTIPSSPVARKIQGLNICLIRRPDPLEYPIGLIDVTLCNKTKDLAWTYYYEDRFEELGRPLEEYMWVSTWKCEDLWEAGDQIQVSFKILDPDWYEKFKVKECGIRIVYEEEEEDLNNSGLLWSDEMDVSFSNYRTPGTHYFLVGLLFKRSSNKEETDGRAVQFVDWWGLNLNWRSKGERLMYTQVAGGGGCKIFKVK